MERDYKNTPQGKETLEQYGDIIRLSRPAPSRPRMDLVQRAKIFSPYDALRGFDEAIDETKEKSMEVEREDLSDEQKEILSDKLMQIRKGMQIRIRHFVPGISGTEEKPRNITHVPDRKGQKSIPASDRKDQYNMNGQYITTEGKVTRIDPLEQTLLIEIKEPDDTGGKIEKTIPIVIRFDDILDIDGNDIQDIDDSPGFTE